MSGWLNREGRGRPWRTLREKVLRRDKGLCQCDECRMLGRVRLAHEVDHIVPLTRGGTDALSNLQAINRECHQRKSTRELGQDVHVRIGANGWPVESPRMAASEDLLPSGLGRSRPALTIVCGPPGAGKTSYVEARKGALDVVIDIAEIKAQLAGKAMYAAGDRWIVPALLERNRRLGALAGSTAPAAWFITGGARATERAHWQGMLGGQVVVLDVPAAECVRRLAADPKRRLGTQNWTQEVLKWWRQYSVNCEASDMQVA